MGDIYESHPKWQELESLIAESDRLLEKAKNLRKEIDNDLFGKKNPKISLPHKVCSLTEEGKKVLKVLGID